MNALMFTALCLIWGTTWMAIKINLTAFPPFYSAGLRFLLAFMVLFLLLRFKKQAFPTDLKTAYPSIIFGLLNGFSYGLVYWGEQFISSGMTAVLNASLPFFSIILAAIFVAEQITFQKTIGVVLGFLGVLLLFMESLTGQNSNNLPGEAAIVLASAIYALAGVYVKKHSRTPPLVAVTMQMFFSAVILLVMAVPLEYNQQINFTWPAFISFLYLGLIGSALAFYIYNQLILRIEVSKLSYVSMVTPAIATLMGVVWLKEALQWQMLVGMVLILVGTGVINIKGVMSVNKESFMASQQGKK